MKTYFVALNTRRIQLITANKRKILTFVKKEIK